MLQAHPPPERESQNSDYDTQSSRIKIKYEEREVNEKIDENSFKELGTPLIC